MVALEQVAPGAVAELGRTRRRPYEVREKDGREDAVSLYDVPLAALPDAARNA